MSTPFFADSLPGYDTWKTTEPEPYVDPYDAAVAAEDALLERGES